MKASPTCPACRGRGVVFTRDHGGERERETCDCVRPRAVARTVVCPFDYGTPSRVEQPAPLAFVVGKVVALAKAYGVRNALEHALYTGDVEGAARLVGRETPAMQLERMALSTARVA